MGVQHHYNETTTTMKSIFLIAAFAALAIASRSADDLVPEEDDIRIMPSLVQESAKGLPQCADIYNDAMQHQYMSQRCLCIPGSQEDGGKNKKYAAKYKAKGYKGCYKWGQKVLNKIIPSKRPKGCDDAWGISHAKDCSPPRPKKKAPKKCTCTIKNAKSHKQHVFSSEGGKAVTVKNAKWGGLFRGMTCTGCEYVKVTDADPNTFWGGYAQDVYLGKNSAARHAINGRIKGAMANNNNCCGKKTCSVESIAGKVGLLHDLRDDVGKIVMQGAC